MIEELPVQEQAIAHAALGMPLTSSETVEEAYVFVLVSTLVSGCRRKTV